MDPICHGIPRLTAILKKATAAVWKQPVNSQLFRQLSNGITEKHVREVCKPFNRYDDTSSDVDLNVVLAWQSGHRPMQRGTTYGLDGAFPDKLQSALLRAYEWASTRWHEFLQLPSKVMRVVEAPTIEDTPGMLSPTVLQGTDANDRPAKRKSLPRVEGVTAAKKRSVTHWDQDLPMDYNEQPAEYESQF